MSSKILSIYKERNHYVFATYQDKYFLLCDAKGNLLKAAMRGQLKRDFSYEYNFGSYVANKIVIPHFSLKSSRLTIDSIAKKLFSDSFPEPELLSASGFNLLGVPCTGSDISDIYAKAKPLGPV